MLPSWCQVWGLGGKGTSGDTGRNLLSAYVCSENVCVFICLDSDLTSSLDGPFHSVHSRHTMTADEEVVLIMVGDLVLFLVLGL